MQSESKTKMTRTTRMIYVEEISDTQNTTSAFPTPRVASRLQTDPNLGTQAPEEVEETGGSDSVEQRCTESKCEVLQDEEEKVMREEKRMQEEIREQLRRNATEEQRPSIELTPSTATDPHRKSLSLIGGSMLQRRAVEKMSDMKSIEDSLLYIHLKLLFSSMKIFGLFFLQQRHRHERSLRGCLQFVRSWQFYSLFIIALLVGNFIRSLLSLDLLESFGNFLFFKLVTCILFYESASRAILAYVCCARRKVSLQDLFLNIETICYSDSIIPYENGIRRTLRMFLVMTFIVAALNCGTTAYGMFGPAREIFTIYLYPFSADTPGVEALQTFLLLLIFVNGVVAILSLCQFTILCYVFFKEFEYHHRTFALKIREDGEFLEELEKFRLMHQKRCRLVQDANQIFKYYVANTYLTNIPLLCLLLYSIVNTEDNSASYRFINVFRLCYVLLQMMVVSIAATAINIQAHGPLADIYNIRVQDSTKEQQLEMAMFLNKLTGTQIGLTPWDMFVINKPSVLAVFGMIITYFFLLIQFRNPLQQALTCNCVVTVINDSSITVSPGL